MSTATDPTPSSPNRNPVRLLLILNVMTLGVIAALLLAGGAGSKGAILAGSLMLISVNWVAWIKWRRSGCTPVDADRYRTMMTHLPTSTDLIRGNQIAGAIFVVSGLAVGVWLLAADQLMQNITAPVFILITGILLDQQARSLKQILRLRQQIQSLAAAAGTSPLNNAPESVIEALRQGNRVLAVKRFREATSTGLAEATDQVDDLIYFLRHTPSKTP